MVRCRFKNGYQKDMYLKEIGLHALNSLSILGSIINIIGGKYVIIQEKKKIFRLKIN